MPRTREHVLMIQPRRLYLAVYFGFENEIILYWQTIWMVMSDTPCGDVHSDDDTVPTCAQCLPRHRLSLHADRTNGTLTLLSTVLC